MSFRAIHDRTGADYQHNWDTLVPQGYRPINLSVYGDRANPLYAAVWVKKAGAPFAGIHGADAVQMQQFFNKWANQGFTFTALSATGPATNPVFAAVMEQSTHGVSLSRFGLRSGSADDENTIEHWIREGRTRNLIPRCVASYGSASDRRFAIVLDSNVNNSLWSIAGWWGESAADYQARFDAQVQQWARPAFVTVSADNCYLSIFRDDSIGRWVARHNLTSQEYQQEFNEWTAQGLMPVCVQAGGGNNGARFAVLFAERDDPYPRSFRTAGKAAAPFSEVDSKIETFMRQNGTRGIGLAVVHGGSLVYARGYTWAEHDYPQIQPTSMFRIASCSKPITSIAIYQLIESGRLSLDDRLHEVLPLTPPEGQSVHPDYYKITVRHLLTHTAGWDRRKVSDLPDVAELAGAFGRTDLPFNKRQVAAYKAGQPLQFVPGSQQEYSNLGFLMLGLIVEARRGTSFEDAVRKHILDPLGLRRPHRTPVAQTMQHPGAVRQHDSALPDDQLRVVPSAVRGSATGNRPAAALPYGGEDYAIFDSFGGWCMAPADYAKILAAVGGHGSILSADSVRNMWTVPSFYQKGSNVELPNYASGWDTWTEGNGIRGVQHFGGMPGVCTRILYRSDGWGFALFSNSGFGLPDVYPELAALVPRQQISYDLFAEVGIPSSPRKSKAVS